MNESGCEESECAEDFKNGGRSGDGVGETDFEGELGRGEFKEDEAAEEKTECVGYGCDHADEVGGFELL